MMPVAKIIHQTPERLRIKIPSRKGDREYFYSLQDKFADIAGVETLKVNPSTSSVLIVHNKSNGVDFIEFGKQQNLFTLEDKSASYHSTLTKGVVGGFSFLNNIIKRIFSHELDIPSIAFITLIGVAIYQIARGNFRAPAWYTAMWYGMNIFLKSLAHKEKTSA